MPDAIQSVSTQPVTERVPYFSLKANEVLEQLGTSLDGLTSEEAARRLAQYGPNVLTEERGVPLWKKFVDNLTNFFAILLWVAAALSFATGGNEAVLIYVPFFQRVFGTAPVGWEGWLVLFAFTPFVFLVEEARKAIVRRTRAHRPAWS